MLIRSKSDRLEAGQTFTALWFERFCVNKKDMGKLLKASLSSVANANATFNCGADDNSEMYLAWDINATIAAEAFCLVTVTPTSTGTTTRVYSVADKKDVTKVGETYPLKLGAYVVYNSKAGYTTKTVSVTIAAGDISTGTKTVGVDALVAKTCVVTFAGVAEGDTVAVLDGATPVSAEEDGTYLLGVKNYTYSVTRSGYAGPTTVALAITTALVDAGAKTITITDADFTEVTCETTISLTPSDAVIVIIRAGGKVMRPAADGKYDLRAMAYIYTATKEGYDIKTGSFTISRADCSTGTKTVTVTMSVDTAVVSIVPNVVGATLVVSTAAGVEQTAEADGTYILGVGSYKYTLSKSGYVTQTDVAFTVSIAEALAGTKTISPVLVAGECVVTFTLTPETADIVVKRDTVVVDAEVDGTYALTADTYTYTATAEGYVTATDVELVISAANVDTGTRTVTVTLTEE